VNPQEQALAAIRDNRPAVQSRAQGVADVAMSERYKAEVFVRREQAMRFPRDIMRFRERLLAHCARKTFAEKAQYAKPVGKGTVRGPSIRFVEAAISAYGNVDVAQQIIQDDAEYRVVRVSVTDLETNVQVSEDVQVAKTVERRNVKPGEEVISERTNSHGSTVYLIPATDDDLQIKIAAAVSKKVRTCGLRILPPDVVEEAIQDCEHTLRSDAAADPAANAKRMCDAFFEIGVSAEQLSSYLGHSALQCTPGETLELRDIYNAIKDGEATWAAVMATKELPEGDAKKSALAEKLAKKRGEG
jgi:hypothetical protein